MGFQRRSQRLNGVLLLDALGEDIPEGGSGISELMSSSIRRLVLQSCPILYKKCTDE